MLDATVRPAYETLFSGLQLGRRRVKNRVVFPATIGNHPVQNTVTDRMIAYYAERARGGAGMIVTEGMSVHPTSVPQPAVVALYEDRNADGLKRLADAVEREDCRLLAQLWHVGRQQLWNPVMSPVGVSAEPDAYSWSVPHVLRPDEIRSIVDGFAGAARRVRDAGFSGAELHGAHGYLITQFLSPWSNTRDDAYGGDRERRVRFVREVIDAIRAETGPDFILGLKMPGEEGVKGGIDPDEAGKIVELLVRGGGLDYIAFSQGNFSQSLEDHVPDMHYAPGAFIHIHKRLKASAGDLPVMAIGRVVDPAQAEGILRDGAADLIAMSRSLLSDAAWPNKARAGRADEIRPCIFCNVCWGEIHVGKPIACIHNPHLATPGEADWTPVPARRGRTVAVIGGGVAGLEAAWVAAARGHAVTLFSRSAELGGKARQEAALPGRGEVAKVYAYQKMRADQHGVAFRTGEVATAAAVSAERPDVVIVATGSRMRRPATLNPDATLGMSLRDHLAGEGPQDGAGTAVLFDQDHTAATYAAADLLSRRFARVVLLTPRTQLARGVPYVSAIGVYRRLYQENVEIVLAATPTDAADGTVTYRNTFNGAEGRIDGVDLFVWSTPRLADDGLATELRAAGFDVRTIGDSQAPRTIMAAVHEGHAAGNDIQ